VADKKSATIEFAHSWVDYTEASSKVFVENNFI
jgi:hypothetical protein